MRERHLLNRRATVREALGVLNALSGGNMTLFVVDDADVLAGSVTDGDVRRALIKGVSLDDNVMMACRPDCMRVYVDEPRYGRVAEAKRHGISLLPLVDRDGHIIDLLDLQAISSALPVDAVLMAGGRGERLRPLTLTTPKPLLPVGGKPIIDHNVDNLLRCGITNIYVTVN
ncbi:MAG: NTP transferase domain-containing protein, partial [Muribaculaceae bacterium]|nr:NTP transferase domain-containing protein [Muribaculaceae bacterium]